MLTTPDSQAADAEALGGLPRAMATLSLSVDHVKAVREVLLRYYASHTVHVTAGWFFSYVAIQTFAVPGSVALSLLGGAIFGLPLGFPLVALTSTTGATVSYFLAGAIGEPLIRALYQSRLERFQADVARHRDHLWNYLLFLRLTPLVPNTLINVASPIAGVPVRPFFFSTLLGQSVANFVVVNAGCRLGELESLTDIADPRFIITGMLIGFAALIPIYLKDKKSKMLKEE